MSRPRVNPAEAALIPNFFRYQAGSLVLRPALEILGGYHGHNVEAFDSLAGQAVLVGSNHSHGIDPVGIGQRVYIRTHRPMLYLAKNELSEKEKQGKLLHSLGAVYTERDTGAGLIGEAFDRVDEAIDSNGITLFFVTGGRRAQTNPEKFKTTIAHLALVKGVAIETAGVYGKQVNRSGEGSRLGLPRDVVFGDPIHVFKSQHEAGSAAFITEKKNLMSDVASQIVANEAEARRRFNQRLSVRVLRLLDRA